MATGNRPEKTFRLGLVSASVFANVRQRGDDQEERMVRTVQLARRYRDGQTWKTSTSFDIGQLPAAIEALRLALAYLVDQQQSADQEESAAS